MPKIKKREKTRQTSAKKVKSVWPLRQNVLAPSSLKRDWTVSRVSYGDKNSKKAARGGKNRMAQCCHIVDFINGLGFSHVLARRHCDRVQEATPF